MTNGKKLLVAALAVAGLSGCASTQYADRADAGARAPAPEQVSRPASYGTLGGYRYRRFVAVTITGA